ncbi:unnamed protein product [Heligmosomoides polygyrus]|uniref:START domain-containing protein n=1 Tax=Heligmosomoides polygyrus TaxID=6339 RepID=A0A183FZT9_HELPZ|nr:unnamed protein product [Heligmosomoides polygyrus]
MRQLCPHLDAGARRKVLYRQPCNIYKDVGILTSNQLPAQLFAVDALMQLRPPTSPVTFLKSEVTDDASLREPVWTALDHVKVMDHMPQNITWEPGIISRVCTAVFHNSILIFILRGQLHHLHHHNFPPARLLGILLPLSRPGVTVLLSSTSPK